MERPIKFARSEVRAHVTRLGGRFEARPDTWKKPALFVVFPEGTIERGSFNPADQKGHIIISEWLLPDGMLVRYVQGYNTRTGRQNELYLYKVLKPQTERDYLSLALLDIRREGWNMPRAWCEFDERFAHSTSDAERLAYYKVSSLVQFMPYYPAMDEESVDCPTGELERVIQILIDPSSKAALGYDAEISKAVKYYSRLVAA